MTSMAQCCGDGALLYKDMLKAHTYIYTHTYICTYIGSVLLEWFAETVAAASPTLGVYEIFSSVPA